MNEHVTPFIGSYIAILSSLATHADMEAWLTLSSLAVGTLAGILGCLSAIHNLRK